MRSTINREEPDIKGLDTSIYRQFLNLHSHLFGDKYTSEMELELEEKKSPLLVLALDKEKLLGFKLGYELKPGTFYSWTGGVSEDSRQKGLGTALMKAQHD